MNNQEKILVHLQNANAWMTGADVAAKMGVKPRTATAALRRLFAKTKVTKKAFPGYQTTFWAHPSLDTSGWADPPPVVTKKQSKKARSKQMCLPIGKQSLIDAVKKVVEEKIAAKAQFSAYDISTALRAAGDAGTSTVDENEVGSVYSPTARKRVPKIDHTEVKDIVHDLFHSGSMTGYDREHTPDGFWLYKEADPKAATQAAFLALASSLPDPGTTVLATSVAPVVDDSPAPVIGGSDYNGDSSI